MSRTIRHKDPSGRVWFHRKESGDGFPKGSWVWQGKEEPESKPKIELKKEPTSTKV